MAVIAVYLGNLLPFLFKNNVDTRGREIMAATLFLSSVVLEISLVVLVFLASLALIGGLSIRYLSREKISRLSFSRVFLPFICRPIPLETLSINLMVIKKWL